MVKPVNPVETAAWELCRVLREAAMAECAKGNADAVHWLVSEERRVARLPHAIELRGITQTVR